MILIAVEFMLTILKVLKVATLILKSLAQWVTEPVVQSFDVYLGIFGHFLTFLDIFSVFLAEEISNDVDTSWSFLYYYKFI